MCARDAICVSLVITIKLYECFSQSFTLISYKTREKKNQTRDYCRSTISQMSSLSIGECFFFVSQTMLSDTSRACHTSTLLQRINHLVVNHIVCIAYDNRRYITVIKFTAPISDIDICYSPASAFSLFIPSLGVFFRCECTLHSLKNWWREVEIKMRDCRNTVGFFCWLRFGDVRSGVWGLFAVIAVYRFEVE